MNSATELEVQATPPNLIVGVFLAAAIGIIALLIIHRVARMRANHRYSKAKEQDAYVAEALKIGSGAFAAIAGVCGIFYTGTQIQSQQQALYATIEANKRIHENSKAAENLRWAGEMIGHEETLTRIAALNTIAGVYRVDASLNPQEAFDTICAYVQNRNAYNVPYSGLLPAHFEYYKDRFVVKPKIDTVVALSVLKELGPKVTVRGDLRRSDLRGVELAHGVSLNKFWFAGANLAGSALWEGDFSGTDLTAAVLANSTAFSVKFNEAVLWNASFYGADLRKCEFRDAQFHAVGMAHPDFRWTNLEGADFGNTCEDRLPKAEMFLGANIKDVIGLPAAFVAKLRNGIVRADCDYDTWRKSRDKQREDLVAFAKSSTSEDYSMDETTLQAFKLRLNVHPEITN